jgi:hypothetical protein
VLAAAKHEHDAVGLFAEFQGCHRFPPGINVAAMSAGYFPIFSPMLLGKREGLAG